MQKMASPAPEPRLEAFEIARSGFPVSGCQYPHLTRFRRALRSNLTIRPRQAIMTEHGRAAAAGAGAKPAVGYQISRRSEVFQNYRLEGNDNVPAWIPSKHPREEARGGFALGNAPEFRPEFLRSPAHPFGHRRKLSERHTLN